MHSAISYHYSREWHRHTESSHKCKLWTRAYLDSVCSTHITEVLTSANFELVLFWIRFPTVLRRWHSQLGRMQCVEKLNAILKKIISKFLSEDAICAKAIIPFQSTAFPNSYWRMPKKDNGYSRAVDSGDILNSLHLWSLHLQPSCS